MTTSASLNPVSQPLFPFCERSSFILMNIGIAAAIPISPDYVLSFLISHLLLQPVAIADGVSATAAANPMGLYPR